MTRNGAGRQNVEDPDIRLLSSVTGKIPWAVR